MLIAPVYARFFGETNCKWKSDERYGGKNNNLKKLWVTPKSRVNLLKCL